MSTFDKFNRFCSNILIDSHSVAKISYRYKRITKQLNKDFWNSESETQNSLYVGSYGRDTDIHTSDIDMLFILPYTVYKQFDNYKGNGQSSLLQIVKNSIGETYPSYMKGDGQVVKINFSDGICFELVPCFINKDGSFTYPDTNDGGKWRITNPKPEIEAIRNANQQFHYNLKRLCRMARAWKDTWDVPMGGLLIDTLAHNFLKDWEHRDKSFIYYDWMTRDFLKYLKDQSENRSYWYAPGSNKLVMRTGIFEYKALRCYNIALEAIQNEVKSYEWSANQKWIEIYGSSFPSLIGVLR
ncbi:hypothetical protein [Nostoc sp. JL33]|uniref:SMODS domain-containing nucleotidyltransferase n=1 Tax=Nostoc sp. JL33 TaxID=2815396 RepID=UPI0025F4FC08|nr:hypothetical protein [Nostoc sp. JL33]MBN3874510.1 nucleotidyltransferase [Nostoc sp. JL33]